MKLTNRPTERRASGERLRDAGFALPAVILVMVLVSALALASLMTTGDERAAGRALRESAKAFYAAEAGANAVIAGWDAAAYDTLMPGPGDSLDLGWQTLDNGASYRLLLRRVDGGSGRKLYAVQSTGRGVGGLRGERTLGVTLYSKAPPVSSIITSAVRGGAPMLPDNDIRLRENERLMGADTIPPQLASRCSNPLQDTPGLAWGDTSIVRIDPPAGLFGDPPLVEDLSIDSTSLWDFGGYNYDDLVAQATNVYDGQTTLLGSDIAPVESGGVCDTSVRSNWGAPDDPSHPCFDHMPIVHIKDNGVDAGKLTATDVVGQGILLIDDETVLQGDFQWYGIVLVKGRVRLRDNTTIIGGLIVGDRWDSRHFTRVQFSNCLVGRALEESGVSGGSTQPLPLGAWSQSGI